jgi:RNA polymerase sigma-70 factor (ECF subfamily)
MVFKAIRTTLLPQHVEALDDVVQETYLRAFSKLHQFRNDSKFSTWIYTIARNESLRMNQKLSKRKFHEKVLDAQLVAPVSQLSSLRVVNDELLKNMPIDFLKVYQSAVSGLSMSEIANELGLPTGTVKSRLSRAREWLQRTLQNEKVDTLTRST